MNCKRIVAALMCAVISLGTTALSLGVPLTLSAEAATIVDSGNYGENIRWELDSDGTLVVRGMGDMGDVGPVKNTPWVKERDLIKKVVISNGITRVGDQNFNTCKNLVSVTLPDTRVYPKICVNL